MGRYRVEFTFDISDEDLDNLILQDVSKPPPRVELPDGTLLELDEMRLSDEQQMNEASSSLGLDRRSKIYNLLGPRLVAALRQVPNRPVKPMAPYLQVVDSENPDTTPFPPWA